MGKQGTLTKAEMQVMNILWSLPSMKGTISDVLEGYGEKKPAYTTVATFMKILLNKGYVGFEKLKGTKTQCYYPLITKQEYTRKVLDGVKEDLFGGSFSSLVRFFVKEERISEEELKDAALFHFGYPSLMRMMYIDGGGRSFSCRRSSSCRMRMFLFGLWCVSVFISQVWRCRCPSVCTSSSVCIGRYLAVVFGTRAFQTVLRSTVMPVPCRLSVGCTAL